MPKQPQLFETSQTAEMLSTLKTYQELTERQQDVVRAYIEAHEDKGGRITKDAWRAKCKELGVSKTRFYEILGEAPQSIYATITEALQQVGEEAAHYGALALFASGLRIYEQIMSGERETKNLTSVELGIMRECVQSLSPARLIGVNVSDGKGNSAQGAVAGRPSSGDANDMASQAAAVAGALREELGLQGGADSTGSGAESAEGAVVASESFRAEGAASGVEADPAEGGSQAGEGQTDHPAHEESNVEVAQE